MAVQKRTAMCKMNNSQEGTFTCPSGNSFICTCNTIFANTILKCAAFPFLTPARKPTVNFYLDVFKKRNKKVDMNHIYKYNKHKQIQHIKSYSIFYAIRQENPNIKDLREAVANSSISVLAASCQKQKKRSEAYGRKGHYRKNSGRS